MNAQWSAVFFLVLLSLPARAERSENRELQTLSQELTASVSDDLDVEISRLRTLVSGAQRSQAQFEKARGEWDQKIRDVQTRLDGFQLPDSGRNLFNAYMSTSGDYDRAVAQKAVMEADLKSLEEHRSFLQTKWDEAAARAQQHAKAAQKLQTKKDQTGTNVSSALRALEFKILGYDLKRPIDEVLSQLTNDKIKLTDARHKLALIEKSLDNTMIGAHIREKFERFAASKEFCESVKQCANPNAERKVNLDKLFFDKGGKLGAPRGGKPAKAETNSDTH